MNKRGLKTRTPLSNAIDIKLATKLKELSEETQIPMSKLLDNAIKLLLNAHGKKLD